MGCSVAIKVPFGLCLALMMPLLAQAADDATCQQELDGYLALNAAPEKGEIRGINQVGLSAEEVQKIRTESGPCAAWDAVIRSLMQQHGKVLDGVEEMTGQPAPKR